MELTYEQQKVIADVRNLVISHPEFNFAYKTIAAAYQLNKNVAVAEHIICVGSSGTGKSTIKQKLNEDFHRTSKSEALNIPILIVDTPAVPTVKNFAEEVLIQLGDPNFAKGSAIEKTNRILRYLDKCEVKLIIFDELQHFIDQGKRRTPFEVSDWLKTLIDKAGVSTVLMGLERSEQILRVNEQLRRRFSKRIDIRPFDLEEKESRDNFIGVIQKLDEQLDLKKRIDLSDKELVISMFFATNGIIDYLVKLLIGAYEHAIKNNRNVIEKSSLREAFKSNIWNKGIGKFNPFNKSFIRTKLDKPGMPFNNADNFEVERH
jgi:hypothetical protein